MNGLIFIQKYNGQDICKLRNGQYVIKTKNKISKPYSSIDDIVEAFAKKQKRKIASKKSKGATS